MMKSREYDETKKSGGLLSKTELPLFRSSELRVPVGFKSVFGWAEKKPVLNTEACGTWPPGVAKIYFFFWLVTKTGARIQALEINAVHSFKKNGCDSAWARKLLWESAQLPSAESVLIAIFCLSEPCRLQQPLQQLLFLRHLFGWSCSIRISTKCHFYQYFAVQRGCQNGLNVCMCLFKSSCSLFTWCLTKLSILILHWLSIEVKAAHCL